MGLIFKSIFRNEILMCFKRCNIMGEVNFDEVTWEQFDG